MSITIINDRPQADGTRLCTYELSLADGHSTQIGPSRVPAGKTATEHGAVLETRWAPRLKASEIERLVDQVRDGKINPVTHTPVLNTQLELQAELVKRLFNLMRDDSGDPDKLDRIAQALPLAGLFSDAQVSALVGWSEADVTATREKLTNLGAALASLDHGKGAL